MNSADYLACKCPKVSKIEGDPAVVEAFQEMSRFKAVFLRPGDHYHATAAVDEAKCRDFKLFSYFLVRGTREVSSCFFLFTRTQHAVPQLSNYYNSSIKSPKECNLEANISGNGKGAENESLESVTNASSKQPTAHTSSSPKENMRTYTSYSSCRYVCAASSRTGTYCKN